MGKQQSKEYYIPDKKNFKLSYCVQESIHEIAEKHEYINLSKLVEEYTTSNLVLQLLYYKLKHEGYSFKEYNVIPISYRIDHILEYISDKGLFLFNNASINDIKIIKTCYESNLNTVYYFLNKGKILLCGILLNEEFIQHVLKIEPFDIHTIISDIILIVGYDTDSIYIKTNWYEHLIKMENIFIKNIREIWNIEIKTFY